VAEREWREASDMRRSFPMFTLTVLIAAVLRFWAIGEGIPFALGVDEPELMDRAVTMMKTGDFNPRFFDYPGLYIYVQLAVACVRFLAGAAAGEWPSLGAVGPGDFYLWGRSVTAFLGTLTVLLVYAIGTRWGARYALLAAGLMAVMPLHVRESHYVLTDVPVTFFVTLTFLLSLRANEQGRAVAFAWAGAAAGLAAATKYNGALAALLPLVAVWMSPGVQPSRTVGALAAIGGSIAAFLIAAPYTILDLPGFLNGFAHLSSSYSAQMPLEAPAVTYLKHLRNSLHWPALLLAVAGMILGAVRAVRGPGRVRWTLAVMFPLLYFSFISRQSLVFGRYLLPLLPFLCLLAAAATVSGVSLLRRFDIPRAARTALIAALTVAALLPPAAQAVGFNLMMSKTSTVEQAHAWILDNLPKGSHVVIETRALLLPAGVYRATNVPRLIVHPETRGVLEYSELVAGGVDYFVASSQAFGPALSEPHSRPEEFDAYMRLFEQSRELVRFAPTASHPGPELRVYKVTAVSAAPRADKAP
jgi:4-amino-4-deoxy-L-arabinose transferase-like glycosyltransferase